MAALTIETPAAFEPVSLTEAKNYLRVEISDDDVLIGDLITAAREAVEAFTGRSLCVKGYRQSLDSFPYFTDSVMSQMAYPPSYYSLPRYSTTLWNYSQMIKLFAPPLVAISRISYFASADKQWHSLTPAPPIWYPNTTIVVGQMITDGNGNIQTAQNGGVTGDNPPTWATGLNQLSNDTGPVPFIVWKNSGPAPIGTFFMDSDSEPARIFPAPAGANWPAVLYVPNAVQIHFTAGYPQTVFSSPALPSDITSGIPGVCKTAIKLLVGQWYENREAAVSGNLSEMGSGIQRLLWTKRVLDFQPTRG